MEMLFVETGVQSREVKCTMSGIINDDTLVIADSSLSEEFGLNWMCRHLLVTNIKIGNQNFEPPFIVPQPFLWRRYFGKTSNEEVATHLNEVEAVITYKEVGPKQTIVSADFAAEMGWELEPRPTWLRDLAWVQDFAPEFWVKSFEGLKIRSSQIFRESVTGTYEGFWNPLEREFYIERGLSDRLEIKLTKYYHQIGSPQFLGFDEIAMRERKLLRGTMVPDMNGQFVVHAKVNRDFTFIVKSR